MTNQLAEPLPQQWTFQDVLFVLFKHKRKILLCFLVGVAAAAAVSLLKRPVFESEAKLLMRYVVERNAIDPVESDAGGESGKMTENLINSEVEILTSWDLAEGVAQAIGPRRISPAAKGDAMVAAAHEVSKGLTVTARKGSNVILISSKNADPVLATRILDELLTLYFIKHLEVHRSADAFHFVAQQSERVSERLTNAENELKQLKNESGVAPFGNGAASLSAELEATVKALNSAEADRTEQQARVQEMEKAFALSGREQNPTEVPQVGKEEVQKYQALLAQSDKLRQKDLELLGKYTPENRVVQLNREQIESLERQRRDMDSKYPGLAAAVPASSAQNWEFDLMTERARLAGFEAKTAELKTRLADLQRRMEAYSKIQPRIEQLERAKELEENNFKYFSSSLEKARIDEALDPSKIPNISVVQKPTPAVWDVANLSKLVLALVGGGLAGGLALAFGIELFMDHTIKRPLELETKLGIPLLLSIPRFYLNGSARQHHNGNGNGNGNSRLSSNGKTAGDLGHFIRPFGEAIRDRLIAWFEVNGMTHKPKLVAVTALSEGAGASTIGASLAACLSETGEGKVLIVDMNVGKLGVTSFFEGKRTCLLSTALQPRGESGPTSGNLYLSVMEPAGAESPQPGIRHLSCLLAGIKASDFDYVIFDMPPLGPTSPTATMAGMMDKVLVVLEAEKSAYDFARRTYIELLASRADVWMIFNKSRSYVPEWLHR